MATLAEVLALAAQHHRAGALQQAADVCRHILQADPDQADALHLVGLLAYQTGKTGLAVAYLKGAIQSNPLSAVFHFDLGLAHRREANRSRPKPVSDKLCVCSPNTQRSAITSGSCAGTGAGARKPLTISGKPSASNPTPRSTTTWASPCRSWGGWPKPGPVTSRRYVSGRTWPGRTTTWVSYGPRRAISQRRKRAIGRRSGSKPDYAKAYHNLGNVLRDTQRFEEARASYEQALRLDPGLADTHGNLGSLLKNQGRLDEASQHLQEAIRLQPHRSRFGVLAATILPPLYQSSADLHAWRQWLADNIDRLHQERVSFDLTS